MALAKHTIGAKIFGAFVAMSAIIGLTGLAGYGVLSAAGNIAVTTTPTANSGSGEGFHFP